MKARWQDVVMLLLGTWLFFSPFWMAGYASAESTGAWNSYAFGLLVGLIAVAALASRRRWEEWIQLVISIWLVISPFLLLFYGNERGAAWNTMLVGVLVGVDALLVLARRPSVRWTA